MIYLYPCNYANDFGTIKLDNSPHIENHFENYFGRRCVVTPSGRAAISTILRSLHLNRDDEVYITTTFDKPNVSSCVTCTIFNFCRPCRVLTDKAKAIFVIHEFGVPHEDIQHLVQIAKDRGIVLIEDCAHAIDSKDNGKIIGTTGDYTICSLTKVFPVRYGGLLVGGKLTYPTTTVEASKIAEVKSTLPKYIGSLSEYSQKRRKNFLSLQGKFAELGLKPLFSISEDISPQFFPVATDKWEEIMENCHDASIECALWHGTNIVVFPCHPFLSDNDMLKIYQFVCSIYKGRWS